MALSFRVYKFTFLCLESRCQTHPTVEIALERKRFVLVQSIHQKIVKNLNELSRRNRIKVSGRSIWIWYNWLSLLRPPVSANSSFRIRCYDRIGSGTSKKWSNLILVSRLLKIGKDLCDYSLHVNDRVHTHRLSWRKTSFTKFSIGLSCSVWIEQNFCSILCFLPLIKFWWKSTTKLLTFCSFLPLNLKIAVLFLIV